METKLETVSKITWAIRNFASLQSASIYSDNFIAGGFKWRLKAYPKGNIKDKHLSLYLQVSDKDSLPIGWRTHAKFSLTVVNKFSKHLSTLKETQHWFDHKSTSWGYEEMTPLKDIYANNGFLVIEELTIVAEINVLEVVGQVDVPEETIDVNGFQILPSQVEPVKRLFERHQDLVSKFRQKNPYFKTAYMNILLRLNQTLCQSPLRLSNDGLSHAAAALAYLRKAGLEVDWLEKMLYEVKEKKKKEEACLARLQEIDKQLTPLKRKLSDLEAQMDKEKEELLAARAPLFSNDDNVV
ncbi:hypothetical protein CARUB_v10015447mg [Capsella rubella]|uniref:MATH domain-containing protein n=1 Tax=Capsella rubella TaxID=81985 RepID=R0G9H6_9BRAS|nr:MATH domain and coiled-coil domain-containing protein At2g05410 [Capsella rubella]EOA32191.1 hypothetical protein CARUB_v10015447mg [Capsella rubella]